MKLSHDLKNKKIIAKLHFFEEVEVETSGKSMFPLFTENTKLLVKKKTIEDILDKYDIILFYNKGKNKIIAHRIYTMSESNVITKGDNCIRCDIYPISWDNIIGFVVAFWKSGFFIERKTFMWYFLTVCSLSYSQLKYTCWVIYHFFCHSTSRKL